jgi:hypothetical protein
VTPAELATRAHSYTKQALERVNAVEAALAIPESVLGDWVSLRRNLESAQSDLETLTKE